MWERSLDHVSHWFYTFMPLLGVLLELVHVFHLAWTWSPHIWPNDSSWSPHSGLMTASYRGQAWWWFIWDRYHARQLRETFQWGLKCLLCIVFLILSLEVSTYKMHYHGHHFIECAYSQTCFQAKLRNGLLLRHIIIFGCRLGKASLLTARTKHIIIHSAIHAYLLLVSSFLKFFIMLLFSSDAPCRLRVVGMNLYVSESCHYCIRCHVQNVLLIHMSNKIPTHCYRLRQSSFIYVHRLYPWACLLNMDVSFL